MKGRFDELFGALATSRVDYILVGGLAAIVHGSARSTYDIDVVYSRTPDNIERLVRALHPFRPYLRGAPEGLPFRFDEETVRQGLNFTLTTSAGPIDLLGEIAGGGSYQALLPDTIPVTIFGHPCRCLTLDRLIHAKRSAGRPRDLEAIAELEALREERARGTD